jgi:demethylmenaquinone methyltransferase/2-methoxy-6-polyprenyl-1,4-benzoquinol methylase
MLTVAQVNLSGHPLKDRIELVQGNAIALPFSDNSFDCATIGFALRNVPDLVKALQEMIRVVKPGGRVVSLELAKPSWPVFKQIYWLYFDKLVPLMGKFRVGIEGPYSYLPNSVKLFPHQKEIASLFSRLGLQQVACYELTGGIVAVHVGIKPNNENF